MCDDMLAIRSEIDDIGSCRIALEDTSLRHPHTIYDLLSENLERLYSRQMAVYPAPWS